jgi:hypothetical protein
MKPYYDRKTTPDAFAERTTAECGLAQLTKQLRTASNISNPVLLQWIRRYGEAARVIKRRHEDNPEGIENKPQGSNKDQ